MIINKFSENIYYSDFVRETDRPVLGYIRGDKFSVMIDAGNSQDHMEEFLREIERMNLEMPKYCVITHHHWDHSFGMEFFKGETIVSRKTNDKLEYLKKLKWDKESVLKRLETGEEIEFAYNAMVVEYENFDDIKVSTGDIIFEDKLILDLGNDLCHIVLVGGPHEEDSSLIYLEKEKVLFAGDAHSGDYYHNEGKIDGEKMKGYIGNLEAIDFNTYILGHDNPIEKETIMMLLKKLI